MKKFDIRTIIVSVLVIAMACSIGVASVSALTVDGSDVLNGLVSAGSSAGIDLNGIINNFVGTTQPSTSQNIAVGGNAQEDIENVFNQIGVGSDILFITDLIKYLESGGSFADWIYDNYGDKIDIPDSVNAMTNEELIVYLMSMVLYPDQTQVNQENTTKYSYSSGGNSSDTPAWRDETENITKPSVNYPADETTTKLADTYKMGDVDGNGKISAMDARLALRVSASLDFLEGSAFNAADVNGDGRITANDARSILRYAAKITNGF